MDLRFNTSLAEGYKSGSQIARVLTEDWLARNMYCPICGEVSIRRAEPNAPVKDYTCEICGIKITDPLYDPNNDINYQIFISGITAKDVFLINIHSGRVWTLYKESDKGYNFWAPME